MEIDEYFKHRKDLLNDSNDEEGFGTESSFLELILPSMQEAKLIDSTEINDSYFINESEKLKLNAYTVNESGERLQLFIVNEESIQININEEALKISQKAYYDNLLNRGIKFINKSIKRQLEDETQDADSTKVLISRLASSEGVDQFDVIEIFLISATATIETRGATPQPKLIEFENEKIKVSFTKDLQKHTKEISIIKKLIDLNFLYNVLISQGNREALTVNFEKLFNRKIEAIKAADEDKFESYLCVLPASILSDLYKEYSSRMLEKNVRSFLQFPRKGVNSGMKDTISSDPGKFIAYNNGLTITSTGKDIEEIDGKYFIKSLTDFQIVNGGQTTATIYFSQKEGISISNVSVMAKINIVKQATNDELNTLISNISKFSNAQSRVSKVDLDSRNSELIKIKALSESVVTPKGVKWFFDRARGELTTMIRKSGSKDKILKQYPKERRFTKEELAKYYSAWGDGPYMVKKGGEKIFRYFIEEISGDGAKKKQPEINRNFYENLVAKIILFRNLEKIYGQGKNSFGQLRASVIPYSISILYQISDGTKNIFFDLSRIWLKEKLDDDLVEFFSDLMKLMNDLIKKYSKSDDLSEYAKNRELWDSISECKEIKLFVNNPNCLKIIKKYSISKEELKKRNEKSAKNIEVDFSFIQENVSVFTNGISFYNHLLSQLSKELSKSDQAKISHVTSCIFKLEDIDKSHLNFETELINRIMRDEPELFDKMSYEPDSRFSNILDFIIEEYNDAIANQKNVISVFNKLGDIVSAKSYKYSSVWGQIGELLNKGESPSIKQLSYACHYFGEKPGNSSPSIPQIDTITLPLLARMVEWESKSKILTPNERQYLADLAYGFKKLNPFHENNAKRHLQKLIKAGFKA